MNYILFDGTVRNALLPFTYTKPVADLRVGILTIREKWEKYLGYTTTTLTEEYLEEKYPMVELEHNVMINASFLPTKALFEEVWNESWFAGGYIWKWFMKHDQVGGTGNFMFTPQNKPVESIIREHYKNID